MLCLMCVHGVRGNSQVLNALFIDDFSEIRFQRVMGIQDFLRCVAIIKLRPGVWIVVMRVAVIEKHWVAFIIGVHTILIIQSIHVFFFHMLQCFIVHNACNLILHREINPFVPFFVNAFILACFVVFVVI